MRGDRGAVLVEFALVAPLLTLLAVGVVDVGRAYRLKTRLANAAREGAVYAQYFPARVDNSGAACADPDNISFAARNEAGSASSYEVTVTRVSDGTAITGCDRTTVSPGSKVVVATSTPFDPITPVVGNLVGSRVTLRARVQVVVQG